MPTVKEKIVPWRRIQFRGLTLWFDPNSLESLCSDDPPDMPPAPEFQHRRPPAPHQPNMLVFNLTHQCNLACEYCFVENYYPDDRPAMPFPTALRALNLLHPGRPFSISFFGGEPLLEWPLLVTVTGVARAMAHHSGVRAHFHVTTNGTLLDEPKCRWLDSQGFSLIVSLDGPKHIHDTARPMRDGEGGSYDAVMKGLEAVRMFPGLARRTTLRGTFSARDFDLVGRVEHLNQLCDDGFAGGVSVEPASLATEGCFVLPDGHDYALRPQHARALRKQYDRLADWWLEREKAGKQPRFMHFAKMLERLKGRRRRDSRGREFGPPVRFPQCSDCGAGFGYMCVNPKGELHACHREGNPIGDVWRGVSERLRAEWLDNRFYSRSKCPACWARNVCGGGCRKDSFDKFADIHRPDPLACFLRQTWILEALWLLANRPQTPQPQTCAAGAKNT